MIAIPVVDESKDPVIDERFGRCEKFCLIDSSNEYRFILNSAKDLGSGAGGQSVKLLADEDVDIIISPHIGPKAMDVINTLNIKVYNIGNSKTVDEALQNLKLGKLSCVNSAVTGLRRV